MFFHVFFIGALAPDPARWEGDPGKGDPGGGRHTILRSFFLLSPAIPVCFPSLAVFFCGNLMVFEALGPQRCTFGVLLAMGPLDLTFF